ncbi:MAG: UbiA family prenyltransferase, partial [Alphaproteobacteria bacterium]
MAEPSARPGGAGRPRLTAVLELLKPITWFAPMWAYGCGVVSSGRSVLDEPAGAVLGVLLAGPLVCATSQAVNDWFDRHVDAINEPHRPIPSGRWGSLIASTCRSNQSLTAWLVAQTRGPASRTPSTTPAGSASTDRP